MYRGTPIIVYIRQGGTNFDNRIGSTIKVHEKERSMMRVTIEVALKKLIIRLTLKRR